MPEINEVDWFRRSPKSLEYCFKQLVSNEYSEQFIYNGVFPRGVQTSFIISCEGNVILCIIWIIRFIVQVNIYWYKYGINSVFGGRRSHGEGFRRVVKKEYFEEVETGASSCMAKRSGGSVWCITSRFLGGGGVGGSHGRLLLGMDKEIGIGQSNREHFCN